jgi:predicted Fe-Mo cluster-binding NifX family protein
MKIGFPVLERNAQSIFEFDENLHNCKYFGIYRCSDAKIDILSIESINKEDEDMGLIHFLKSNNISSIISPQCHSMAGRLFQNYNIKVYKANGSNVVNNLKYLLDAQLECFNADTIIQKSCSSDCSQCSSTCNDEIQEVVAI